MKYVIINNILESHYQFHYKYNCQVLLSDPIVENSKLKLYANLKYIKSWTSFLALSTINSLVTLTTMMMTIIKHVRLVNLL